jgi:nucleoside-diphosphate-sugar epimerase
LTRAPVTGAAGFSGSYLSTRLIYEGLDVLGGDCFTPHYGRRPKELNIGCSVSEKHFGSPAELAAYYGVDPPAIVATVERVLARRAGCAISLQSRAR